MIMLFTWVICRYINNEVIPKNIKHIIRSYNTGTEDIVDICMSELLIELCDMRDGRSFCDLDSHHVTCMINNVCTS